MKLKCLFLLLLLGISFCVHAQKRPVILEKQLEIIRKEPDNGDALKFLCQYYLNKGDYSKTITYAEIMKNVADKTKKSSTPTLFIYLPSTSTNDERTGKNSQKKLEPFS